MTSKTIFLQVGKNLQMFRRIRHFSQLELSLRSHVDRSYIAKLELGRVNPSIRILNLLANALNIPTYYLVRINTPAHLHLRKMVE